MDAKTLLGMDLAELRGIAEEFGEPSYRAQQLFESLYRHRIEDISRISTLPADLRAQLTSNCYSIGAPQIDSKFQSIDGTVRYLIACADGQTVEAVWMPDGDGGESADGTEAGDELDTPSRSWRRATICISSQIGCAVDCQFCLTALLGVKRNLTAGEIVGQVCAILRDQQVSPPEDRVNLVFMGMGEPFLNYENFMKAVHLFVDGVRIPESRMTVSTAGIVPRIRDFGFEPVRPKLAISLNASNDALRTELMPINRKWNLCALIDAAREFPLRQRERLTFEYVLLDKKNDAPENAREVVELIRGLRVKVNLIALNPGPGINFQTPSEDRVGVFQRILRHAGIPAFVRRPRGRDIYAACGQLKRTVEQTRPVEITFEKQN
jgi:23S rRNA (adenine2503-C2)-methyltransferase